MDTSIAPKGLYIKNTLKELKKNDAFSGLKYDDLTKLGSYVLMRPNMQKEKNDLKSREDDIFNPECLDSVEDSSKETWTVQRDEVNQAVVILRSRLWPGASAFAKANTNVFGSVYIGDGIKN